MAALRRSLYLRGVVGSGGRGMFFGRSGMFVGGSGGRTNPQVVRHLSNGTQNGVNLNSNIQDASRKFSVAALKKHFEGAASILTSGETIRLLVFASGTGYSFKVIGSAKSQMDEYLKTKMQEQAESNANARAQLRMRIHDLDKKLADLKAKTNRSVEEFDLKTQAKFHDVDRSIDQSHQTLHSNHIEVKIRLSELEHSFNFLKHRLSLLSKPCVSCGSKNMAQGGSSSTPPPASSFQPPATPVKPSLSPLRPQSRPRSFRVDPSLFPNFPPSPAPAKPRRSN
ncbi:uncharacterized protein LOC124695546 [Lolium rigidum]|uniref:uncharacterized protein LOC124695546 n=1 Tax=Lolium rigidum TaxID=89674 RepID=UPI001F5C2302|nr:uncharacterized protein LOC124695546 [Lolium rigidum]